MTRFLRVAAPLLLVGSAEVTDLTFFEDSDTNKDGALSFAEAMHGFRQIELKVLAETLAGHPVDENSDGKISREEAKKSQAYTDESFDMADENKDGELTIREFVFLMSPHLHEPSSRAAHQQTVKKLDQNGDGKLSIEELHHPEKPSKEEEEEFEADDTDRDGLLSVDELMKGDMANCENAAATLWDDHDEAEAMNKEAFVEAVGKMSDDDMARSFGGGFALEGHGDGDKEEL